MQEFHDLKRRVYGRRSDHFLWDLATSFDLNGDYRFDEEGGDVVENNDIIVARGTDEGIEYVEYHLNNFVATKTAATGSSLF